MCFTSVPTLISRPSKKALGLVWRNPPRVIMGFVSESQIRTRLAPGGNRIRPVGPAEKETAVERGPAADHRRLARRPVLNDPHPAYRSGISRRQQPRDLFTRAGPMVRIRFPP